MTSEPEALEVPSERGPVRALYHAPGRNGGVVVTVGGFDGGVDGPAERLYPALADDLAPHRIGLLRLDFRDRVSPGIVDHGAADLRAGIAALRRRGVPQIALVGHSFGGAVVIAVASEDPAVAGVVTLSTQTAGAQGIARIAPRPVLLVHGADDQRLSPMCSRQLYQAAGEPRQLVLLEGATHGLRQRAAEVRQVVGRWLIDLLGRPP